MTPETELFGILKGEIIDPEVYLKVVNHDLRREILHTLFNLSRNGPISKSQIGEELNLGYHKMLYQLTEHLNYFWKVDYEKKIRGAREEYISPIRINTIYCLLGADAQIDILDPLAQLYGKIADVGVRCDKCPQEQVDKCSEIIKKVPCLPQTEEVIKRREIILMKNARPEPYKPLDMFLICTLIKSLENKPCELFLTCKMFSEL